MDLTSRAKQALWKSFVAVSPHKVDAKGYLANVEHNLLPGVRRQDFETDLKKGRGNELNSKFLAVHSSSALAVNTFCPFKNPENRKLLTVADHRYFNQLHFEKQLGTGLGGTPPNLDVVMENEKVVVGIESKCLEYLIPKIPGFTDSYDQRECLNVEDMWWDFMKELKQNPEQHRQHLDVAQLVKHYLGLRKQYAGKRQITLMYIFWEPENWQRFEEFKTHRQCIERFAGRIKGSEVAFVPQSYPALWAQWSQQGILPGHVTQLQKRYFVAL